MLDHTTLINLSCSLGGLFWRDLERHHPGIASFTLAPEVAAAWKQRVLTKTRQVTGPDGQTSEVRERRASGLHNMAAVRAFYLDIAQWAMEDPAWWAPWAAPCPIRAEDLARQKEIRSRKSRMDQRARERLPALPVLLSRVHDAPTATAATLAAVQATPAGGSFAAGSATLHRAITADPAARTWANDPATGKRRDLTGEEDRAFWTWVTVETLHHNGIRIEELTEQASAPARLPGSSSMPTCSNSRNVLRDTLLPARDPFGERDLVSRKTLAMVAEFEADLARARTREGMAVAKAKGRLRGKRPKLKPAQEEHLVKLWRDGTHTVVELAGLFSVSRSTVYRAVERASSLPDTPAVPAIQPKPRAQRTPAKVTT